MNIIIISQAWYTFYFFNIVAHKGSVGLLTLKKYRETMVKRVEQDMAQSAYRSVCDACVGALRDVTKDVENFFRKRLDKAESNLKEISDSRRKIVKASDVTHLLANRTILCEGLKIEFEILQDCLNGDEKGGGSAA